MDTQTSIEILVVDDEKYICGVIEEALSSDVYNIITFTNPLKALDYIEHNHIDLVLTDLVMGEQSGIQVLDMAKACHNDAVVILMTAHPTVQAAISVLKKGAYDFLIKPFRLETLKNTIKRGVDHQKVLRENLSLKGQVEFLKLTQANISETDIDTYLRMVVEFCRKEFSASGASIIQVKPNSSEILRCVVDSDYEFKAELTNEELLHKFLFSKSANPTIETRKIVKEDLSYNKVFISKPIFDRLRFYGIINLLIEMPFGKITPGELDLLSILASAAGSAIVNNNLYDNLQVSYLQAIKGLANSIEARDTYTAGHTDRVMRLAETIARYIGWDDQQIEHLVMGCTLHDIGKLGVPDSILNKPGKLTEKETGEMRQHPILGLKIIEGIDLFKPAIPYISSHHECYDGSGYPNRLKGDEIPIEGRLLAVADTFDAIMSDRPYRKGSSFETAINELIKNSGRQFDPFIVNKFIELIKAGVINFKEFYQRDLDLSCLDVPEVSCLTEKVSV